MEHRHATGLVPLACLLLVGGGIGLTNNIAKVGIAHDVPLLALLFWGVVGAAVLLTALAILAGTPPAFDRRTLIYGLISGLLLMALPTGITYLAARHVGAGFISLSLAFVPLITYVFAIALKIEANRWVRVAGVIAGLGGALLLAFGKTRMPDAEPTWIAATLAIPVIIATGNIYRTLRWPTGATALALAPLMLAGAALWLLPLALSEAGAVLASGAGLALAAAQAAIFTLTYSLYFVLQRISGAVYLSQIGSVGAVTGAGIAVLAFGEAMPPGFAMAAALIVVGLALFNIRRKPA
jgi:drug/metabolite transporter (DMT)-like permease